MYDGDPGKKLTGRIIDVPECIREIKQQGFNFSMHRFMTAIMMVVNVNSFEYDTKNGILNEWAYISDGTLIAENTCHTSYKTNLERRIVGAYVGDAIDEFDDNSHETINIIKEYSLLIVAATLTVIFGILTFIASNAYLYFNIFGALSCMALCFFIYSRSSYEKMIASKKFHKRITTINKQIDIQRDSIINTMAEKYVYENKLTYEHIQRYIDEHQLKDKSLSELVALSTSN